MNTLVDFPLNITGIKISSSKVLRQQSVTPALPNGSAQPDFLEILMRQLNFPFVPYTENGTKAMVLFEKKTPFGASYVTQEFLEVDISFNNIKRIQDILQAKNFCITTRSYYGIVFTLLTTLFRIHTDNFAIYGRDNQNQSGYLSFCKFTHVPVISYVQQ